MNYGYAPLSADLAGTAEPEKYCLQLYRRLMGDADLRGKKVVEVSCGRGGGAAHVAATYQPASYLGIDISERNLGLATQRFSERVIADVSRRAMRKRCRCPMRAAMRCSTSKPLISMTTRRASSPKRFACSSRGGTFFHVDLAWKDKDPPAHDRRRGIQGARGRRHHEECGEALDLDSVRREAIVMSFPESLRKDFRDWSGVKDFRAYNRLKTGEWVYRITRADVVMGTLPIS